MKWIYYIFSHSIFVAIGAVALCFQTYQMFHLQASFYFFFFIFFATINAYNCYWFFSKYNFQNLNKNWLQIIKQNLISIFLFAISSVYLIIFLVNNQSLIVVTAIAALLSIIYSLPILFINSACKLKPFGFLKTILLAFTWAFITVVFPVQYIGIEHSHTVVFLLIHRFLFMLLLCIIFDARDARIDAIRNLHSIATGISKRMLAIIFCMLLLLFIALPFMVELHGQNTKQKIATIVTGVIIFILFIKSFNKKQGYLFYYFLVDGCMILYPAMYYLASI